MSKHYRKETDCLNCGATLQGHFCHNCGQENLEIHESFGHMMDHAVSDYFHFDHQFFHTIKPLLFEPGFLTNEYMAGKRAKYLHPVKMYIFISIMYFLIAFNVRESNGIIRIQENPPPTSAVLEKQKALINADKTIDAHSKQAKLAQLTENDTSYAQYEANQKKLPADVRDGFWGNLIQKRVYDYKERYGKGAPSKFIEEVQHNIPKMMFVLLPLFAWQLKIAFSKNKKFYVEHLIFAFHYFCFSLLFLSIMTILEIAIPSSWTSAILWIKVVEFAVIVLYFCKALRTVYHRSRFRTVTKAAGVLLLNFALSLICLGAVVIITGLI